MRQYTKSPWFWVRIALLLIGAWSGIGIANAHLEVNQQWEQLLIIGLFTMLGCFLIMQFSIKSVKQLPDWTSSLVDSPQFFYIGAWCCLASGVARAIWSYTVINYSQQHFTVVYLVFGTACVIGVVTGTQFKKYRLNTKKD